MGSEWLRVEGSGRGGRAKERKGKLKKEGYLELKEGRRRENEGK